MGRPGETWWVNIHCYPKSEYIECVIDAFFSYSESQIIIRDIFLCNYYFNQVFNC